MSGGAQVVMLVPGSGCKYGWSFAHSLLLVFYCGAQLGAPAIDNNCKLWTKYNQLPEGSGKWTKVGRFWRGMETLKEAPVLSEFPISNALGSRQATITSWWRATELTKTEAFLLKNQRTQSGSATATAKWGRKSQKGEYQRRKALHFMYRLCPSLWMIADHTHRGQTQRRLKLRLKELSWGPAHHRWDRVCSLTLIKWIVKTKTSTLFHKHHRNQAKCSWHPGYILKLIDIPITRKRKRE